MDNNSIKYQTEEDLIKGNPWRELITEEIFTEALFSANSNFSLEQDDKIITLYNNAVKDSQKLNLHLLPQPWLGNPIRAKVIILNKYPAYADYVQRIAGSFIQHWPQINESLMASLMMRLQLFGEGLPFLGARGGKNGAITYGDAATLYDAGYWWKRLWTWRYPERGIDMDEIMLNTAIINYIPYYCSDFAKLPRGKRLPSQYFTHDLIEYIEAMCPDTIFIVSRGASDWKQLLGRSWNALEESNRIFELPKTAAFRQSLGPTTLGTELYSRIVELLTAGSGPLD